MQPLRLSQDIHLRVREVVVAEGARIDLRQTVEGAPSAIQKKTNPEKPRQQQKVTTPHVTAQSP